MRIKRLKLTATRTSHLSRAAVGGRSLNAGR